MSQSLTTRVSPCCWRTLFHELRPQKQIRRPYHLQLQTGPVTKVDLPPDLPKAYWSQLPARLRPDHHKREILVRKPPVSEAKTCKNPVALIEQQQLALLDPTGARARLFDKTNLDRAKVGDILYTTFKSGEPFAGVILSIKGSGPGASVLLRNHLTKIAVEMSIKIYSPLVQSMEIAQRAPKRKRRARIYYMRKPEHDLGSVQKVVDQYLRQRAQLTGAGRASGQQRAGLRPAKKGKK
ncbi:uncharacterized protein A1O9_12388 [Exophiala aquamarina CBS 119918]|uniref:Ribosomal protein L19 n=1 Tax=Exophiala aquamarina CBS 119918 TaxID=1182545 RepID=A0A072NV24_9EURO|nr:uncharacterized protein A1O9_12388 [Exophiala aquamarina CBS 119918]KEF51471.1 hypothetical protein A1O9_12388 [Exophiala aquamarina CBS 119918]